jgi:hypothetical protein
MLYQLNLYSVAPVAIFEAARVWPSGTGTRHALGGGVRFSLAVVNFTDGYAANPRRPPGEGSGAFFLKLDVTNLFHLRQEDYDAYPLGSDLGSVGRCGVGG